MLGGQLAGVTAIGAVLCGLRDLTHRDGPAIGLCASPVNTYRKPMAALRLWSDVYMTGGQLIGGTQIRVLQQPWIDAPVDALVLSANNHLWLRNATGNAAALHRRCPDLHDEVMASVPAGGFRPGEGLVTRGPGRAVIHAVTVSYYSNRKGPVASTSSVAAACEYALDAAVTHAFRSLAFSPMALRGHAKDFVTPEIAQEWFPTVQAGVIASFLATGRAPELERIDFCIDSGIPRGLQSTITAAFADTIEALTRVSP